MAIYLDNAATTRVDDKVIEAMTGALNIYGNPSSVYTIGREAKSVLEKSRETVAKVINAETTEIFFTSCGTESDNWAIRGVAETLKEKGNHIITTVFEHHAVLHTCEYLEKNGFEVTYLPVSAEGIINIEDLKNAIRPTTILITVMFGNNEIGTIQPIKEIGTIAREKNILFHTDAVQAFAHEKIDVKDMNIDLLSASGHKIHAAKGVGMLYIRKGIKLTNLLHGGAQEKKRRGGTENIPNIVGFAKACEIAMEEFEENHAKITKMRNHLMERILTEIPHTRLNGSRESRLAGNCNISFDFIEGESILLMLDMNGIYASSGSACTSGSLDPSHVLLSLGCKHEQAHGSLRLSIGKYNTMEELDEVVEKLKPIINRLREMSPLYENFVKGVKGEWEH